MKPELYRPSPPTPPVVWLYGLPCSGKTTLATALRDHLQAAGHPVVLLDGDDLRAGLCADLGFSDADRGESLRRAAHLAALLARQDHRVVCAFVTPKERHRALVREILGPALRLIHVACSLPVCMARDVKGLYARAAAGKIRDLTGFQAPFELPEDGTPRVVTEGKAVPDSLRELLRLLGGE